MIANYLMYSASVLYFICYLPELYANYKNKNANIYNLPEKVIMLIATALALSYSVINNNPELMANYAPLIILDVGALTMRLYYARKNETKPEMIEFLEKTSDDIEEIIDMFTVDIHSL